MSFRPGTFFGSKQGDDEWNPTDEGHSPEDVKKSFLDKKRKQPPRKATSCKVARKSPPATPNNTHKNQEQAEPTRVPVAKLKSTFKKHAYTICERKRDLNMLEYFGFSEAFGNLMIDQWVHQPMQKMSLGGYGTGTSWYLSAHGRDIASPIGWSFNRDRVNMFLFFLRSEKGDWEVKATINKSTGAGEVFSAVERPMLVKPGFVIRVAPFVFSVLDNMFANYLEAKNRTIGRSNSHESDTGSELTSSTAGTSGSDTVGHVARSSNVRMDSSDSKPAAKLGEESRTVYHDVI